MQSSSMQLNNYGQQVGDDVPNWTPRPHPTHKLFQGKHCKLVKPDPDLHAKDIYEAHADRPQDWTYMFQSPYKCIDDAIKHCEEKRDSTDPLHFTIIDNASGKAVGTISLMRIDTTNGVVEVGHVTFSDKMKRSFISTEAQYLLMKYVFENLGYRRYEWKCHSMNAPSRAAAKRLGFQFEGTFRNHLVTFGRNRDTCWFSIIDSEWPTLKTMFESYLADDNNNNGQQIKSLSAFKP